MSVVEEMGRVRGTSAVKFTLILIFSPRGRRGESVKTSM
jgi:hypothetical protein